MFGYLSPDGKSQVTVEYENGIPKRVETVVISTQHNPDVEIAQLREDISENLIKVIISGNMLDENTKIYINHTGRFVLGDPVADTGLTGRKSLLIRQGHPLDFKEFALLFCIIIFLYIRYTYLLKISRKMRLIHSDKFL